MTVAAVDQLDLDAINPMLESQSPGKIVEWAVATFGDEIVMSSAFSSDSAAFIHLVTSLKPNIRIIVVDTGYLFPQTHSFISEMQTQFNLNLRVSHTQSDPVDYLKEADETNPMWRNDVAACCNANKIEPFNRAMRDLKPRAWLRGVRRDQTPERKNFQFLEWSRHYDCYAVSPILNWADRDIKAYMNDHALPHHPLREQGYLNIGCQPLSCTRPVVLGKTG